MLENLILTSAVGAQDLATFKGDIRRGGEVTAEGGEEDEETNSHYSLAAWQQTAGRSGNQENEWEEQRRGRDLSIVGYCDSAGQILREAKPLDSRRGALASFAQRTECCSGGRGRPKNRLPVVRPAKTRSGR